MKPENKGTPASGANQMWGGRFTRGPAAVMEAIAEASAQTRADNEAQVAERIQFLADKGMEVIQPSAEDLAKFREMAQPSYMSWLKEQGIGEAFIEKALKDASM